MNPKGREKIVEETRREVTLESLNSSFKNKKKVKTSQSTFLNDNSLSRSVELKGRSTDSSLEKIQKTIEDFDLEG
jgi:hypothetical protein